MVKKMKDLTFLKTHLFAHRGLHSKDLSIPENSMAAFKAAMAQGFAIELDVNVTKDGVALSFHDNHLKRLCNDARMLSDVTYEDIKHLKLLKTNESIPTFKEVLTLVSGKVPLLIELKPHGDIPLLCQSVMHDLEDYNGQYALFSFHPKAVHWLKKHHPDVIRGQISEYFKDQKMSKVSKYLMRSMFFNRFTRPDFISYGIKDLPNPYLDRLKKKGMTIISYAAKTQEELDFVRSHYDNVVFEYFIPKR
jgi:glycerophosphoryl diester phosphodiesterase